MQLGALAPSTRPAVALEILNRRYDRPRILGSHSRQRRRIVLRAPRDFFLQFSQGAAREERTA
jgi:hypothetical protein